MAELSAAVRSVDVKCLGQCSNFVYLIPLLCSVLQIHQCEGGTKEINKEAPVELSHRHLQKIFLMTYSSRLEVKLMSLIVKR